MPRVLNWYGIALAVLIADQLTKTWIVGAYSYGDSTLVTGFFIWCGPIIMGRHLAF